MSYLFTSESVSEGHPDKVADQISDALIDNFLAFDPESKVACETMVTTGQVILAGEVKSKTYLDVQKIARDVINKIGYTKSEYMFDGSSCGVLSAIHEQSPDINRGVDRASKEEQGAGDQGLMFGYASNETDVLMPAPIYFSHRLVEKQAELLKSKKVDWLRPDAKSQVTFLYEDNKPKEIDTVVLSTQHDSTVNLKEIREFVIERGKRIPLQHILGKVNFAGIELYCDNRALIPRPETEELVNLCASWIAANSINDAPLKILEAKNEDDIVTLTGPDQKTKGLMIGAKAANLRMYEKIVQKYYPQLKEIKVV